MSNKEECKINDYKTAFSCFKKRFLDGMRSIFRDANDGILNKESIDYLIENFANNGKGEDENFIDEVKQILEIQKKQKQRGLNDYNMVNVVRSEKEEVGMHSNVIYSLIDPNGLHYQDDLFLNLFIEKVLGLELKDFGTILSVNKEEPTKNGGRIDFTIKSTNYYIGIEMKIDAGDSQGQLSSYYDDLSVKAKKDNVDEKNIMIYYLTKFGTDASLGSSKEIKYKKISFEKHILPWLGVCQYEVSNITNLKEAFENYKNIVKKIVNKYEGKVMALEDKLLENIEENIKLAHVVSEAFEKMHVKFIKNCVEELNSNQSAGLSYCDAIRLNADNAIDIKKNNEEFTVRILIQNKRYKIQIFGTEYGNNIDTNKKEAIFEKLKKIDEKFDKKNDKAYGELVIGYENFKVKDFKEILLKLFKIPMIELDAKTKAQEI